MTILAFIFWVVITFFVLRVVAHYKDTQPKNKVHFYVTRDGDGKLELWLGKPKRWGIPNRKIWFTGSNSAYITSVGFKRFGINVKDFQNIGWEDEPVEVFLNLKE